MNGTTQTLPQLLTRPSGLQANGRTLSQPEVLDRRQGFGGWTQGKSEAEGGRVTVATKVRTVARYPYLHHHVSRDWHQSDEEPSWYEGTCYLCGERVRAHRSDLASARGRLDKARRKMRSTR